VCLSELPALREGVFLAGGGRDATGPTPMPCRAHPHPPKSGTAGHWECRERHVSLAPARAKAPTSLEERLAALAELVEGLGRSSR
jgi:hypothetical protein